MIFSHSNRHKQFVLSFWLSFIILLSLNLLIWIYLTRIRDQFGSELKSKLLTVNKLIARIIDENEISNIIPGERSSVEYLYYQQILEDLRRQSELQTIQIISPAGDVIVAAPETESSASVTNQLFKKAKSGFPQISEIESYASQKFMSAYMPIADINGFVSAVVVIEAKAEYFTVLDQFKTRIVLLTTVNLTAILLIAFFLSRMLKRSIKYQTELKERQHLAQIGEMAATVAHELRNPLAIIEASNDIIKKKYSRQDDETFSYISDEVKRLDILIDDFLKLTKTPVINIEKINLKSLLGKLSLFINDTEMSVLSIDAVDNIEIYSDKNLLEQIILNILRNAFQAIKKNKNKDKHVSIVIKAIKNANVNIIITDNGCGISEENLKKIFSPFFTTKEQGTGLGLSVSKRLTELLGGTIDIHSQVDKGTKVTIQLPTEKDRNGDKWNINLFA